MNSRSINRNVWALTLSLCLGVIGYSAFSAQAADPPKGAEKRGIVSVEEFKVRLAATEKKLGGIEALVGRVESRKLITQADSDDFDKSMHDYAEAMKAALDTALNEAEKASKSQGKGGNTKMLEDFERTAKAHEARVKQIETRTRTIDMQLKMGTIKLDKPLLEKLSPQQRAEFKQYLRPEGVKEMEKLYPDLFKGLPPSGATIPRASAAPKSGDVPQGVPCFKGALYGCGITLIRIRF